jgi:hypothetical protein
MFVYFDGMRVEEEDMDPSVLIFWIGKNAEQSSYMPGSNSF